MLFYNLNLSRTFIIVGTNIYFVKKKKDISKWHVLYNKNCHNSVIFNDFLNFNEILTIALLKLVRLNISIFCLQFFKEEIVYLLKYTNRCNISLYGHFHCEIFKSLRNVSGSKKKTTLCEFAEGAMKTNGRKSG